MRFLNFLLIILCSLSIGWSTLFLLGPSGVKWFIIAYSGGQIIPSNISVTPKLDVAIGLLSFSENQKDNKPILIGSSRAISIKWSILFNEPFLSINIGPTVFEGVSNINKIKISTPSLTDLDFKKLSFVAEANLVELDSYGEASKLEVSGMLTNNFKRILFINFNLSQLTADEIDINSIENVSGNISKIELDSQVSEQNISGKIFGENLYIKDLNLKATKAESEFQIDNGKTQFGMVINKIKLLEGVNGSIGQAKLSGEISDRMLVNQARLEIDNGSFFDGAIEVKKAMAKINFPGAKDYTASVKAELGQIDMNSEVSYLGKLPASNLSFDLNVDGQSGRLQLNSEINLTDIKMALISGSGDINGRYNNWSELYECTTSKCQITELTLDYGIRVNDERIGITSSCASDTCKIGDLRYLITTSNTDKIFKVLSDVNFLNPIILAYLYAAIAAGESVGDGHRIKM